MVECNWRCGIGELDLVVRDGPVLVFVEVKTRQTFGSRDPYLFENIRQRKSETLKHLADEYLRQHFTRAWKPENRIDFLGVLVSRESRQVVGIEHIVSAL